LGPKNGPISGTHFGVNFWLNGPIFGTHFGVNFWPHGPNSGTHFGAITGPSFGTQRRGPVLGPKNELLLGPFLAQIWAPKADDFLRPLLGFMSGPVDQTLAPILGTHIAVIAGPEGCFS
jgi:hypothetical protein